MMAEFLHRAGAAVGIETAEHKARREFAQDCAAIFERTPEGQRIWARWRRVLTSGRSFVPGQTDMTSFNEGKREALLEIQAALDFYHSGMSDQTKVITERPKE